MEGRCLVQCLRADGQQSWPVPSSTRSQPAFKHASSKVGETPSPPAEPGAAGLDHLGVTPGSLGCGGCSPPTLPGPDMVLVGALLSAGQGETSLNVGCSWDPLPQPVGLSGHRLQLPAQAVTPPLDSDRHLTAVLISLGFSLLNTRENSQRSLLDVLFLWKFEDKSCCSLFKKQHWIIFHLLLNFFFSTLTEHLFA